MRHLIFDLIETERDRQDSKWGRGSKPLSHYLVVLQSELLEANQGWLKNKKGKHSVTRELLQVATVAVAALEHHYAELHQSYMEDEDDN
jgi:NTP pyrophosphatase (non-canonical NTP hydrolase)